MIYHQAPSLNSTLHYGSRLVFGRDGTLFITHGERSITEGRMQAQRMDSLLGKIVRINADGIDPEGQPVRRQGRRAAGDLVARPSQRPGRGAASRRPASCGKSSTARAAATRSTSSRKGKDYGWPTIAYGIEYRGGPITGDITAQGRHGAADLLLGSGDRAERHGVLHRRAVPGVEGQPVHRRAQTNDLVRLSTSRAKRSSGEERLLTDLPKRERIRDVRQGPDGALICSPTRPSRQPAQARATNAETERPITTTGTFIPRLRKK